MRSLPPPTLSTFYRGTMKSILANKCLQLDIWSETLWRQLRRPSAAIAALPSSLSSRGRAAVLDHLGHLHKPLQHLPPSVSQCCLLHILVLIHIVLLSGMVDIKVSLLGLMVTRCSRTSLWLDEHTFLTSLAAGQSSLSPLVSFITSLKFNELSAGAVTANSNLICDGKCSWLWQNSSTKSLQSDGNKRKQAKADENNHHFVS